MKQGYGNHLEPNLEGGGMEIKRMSLVTLEQKEQLLIRQALKDLADEVLEEIEKAEKWGHRPSYVDFRDIINQALKKRGIE